MVVRVGEGREREERLARASRGFDCADAFVWHADPETTHPRLLERLRLPADGRTLVVVDEQDTPTAARADVHLRLPGGVEPLMEFDDTLLGETPNAAFLHALDGRAELALHELVRRLNGARHVTTLRLGSPRGADDTLAWQTGYAGTVDLGSGHPEPPENGVDDLILVATERNGRGQLGGPRRVVVPERLRYGVKYDFAPADFLLAERTPAVCLN